ncbi:MAG: hypothetical protein ABEJ59_00275 [Halanaeroarchaeum sp.]
MGDLRPVRENPLARGTVGYERVQVVVAPEGPYHFAVLVRDETGVRAEHAVEYVAINGTTVDVGGPIWFVDTNLDVGVPVDEAGETAWVWP